jgi:alanine racemase
MVGANMTDAGWRPVRLRFDGNALVANWRWLAQQSSAAQCGAAVKADGYGLGARQVVERLSKAGCQQFFVAHWAEAVNLAGVIPPEQIGVLNGLDADDPADVLATGAIPVLNTPGQVARWREAGGGLCHVMLDSGINRLGIGPEQLRVGLFDGLEIDVLMSHLASADEDVAQNAAQLREFMRMAAGISARRRSFANSAGIMLGRDYHFDLTRPGLSLYGGIARREMAEGIQQVVHPQALVLQVRDLPVGARVGYNATYVCERPIRAATVATGYADGYGRRFTNQGAAWFEGCRLPLIGRVSMDLAIFDASAVSGIGEGDWVDIEFDLPASAAASGRSQYELLTGLSKRADRMWA